MKFTVLAGENVSNKRDRWKLERESGNCGRGNGGERRSQGPCKEGNRLVRVVVGFFGGAGEVTLLSKLKEEGRKRAAQEVGRMSNEPTGEQKPTTHE